ncbi:MAG: DMT family transporter [Myxococcales bacterium]|nr:DMT family transporter [Myxococcales bacterium]
MSASALPATRPFAALSWMLLASLLFSVMNLLGRVAGSGGAHWAMVGAVRAFAGAVIAFLVLRAQKAEPPRVSSPLLWVRSGFGTAAMALTFYVLARTDIALGDAVTLFNLTPVFVACFAPLVLRERSGPILAISVSAALVGTLLVIKPPSLFAHDGPRPSTALVAAAIGAALLASFAMLALRRIGPRESTAGIALHFSLTATVVLGSLAIPSFVMPHGRELSAMVVGGASAGLAQLCMPRAYMLERAALVATFGSANVVFTALFGALLLAEFPDRLAVMGMALIVAAGAVLARTSGHAKEAAP